MFKKIITACAGLVLSGSVALAADVSGVYSGSNNGQNVVITLASQGGVVRGQVSVGGQTLPLAGREQNGTIQGVWRNANGQDIPFVAAVGPDGMQLQTAGINYALARQNAGGAVAAQPPANPMGAPVAGADATPPANVATPVAPAGPVKLETRQGKVMQCDVPAGWQFSDTTNGVDTSAPDGITQMSHTFLRGVGQCTPDIAIKRSMSAWGNWGIANVKLVSAKVINPQTKLYEFSYTLKNHPAKALFQVSVSPAPESYFEETIFIQSAPETFDQYLPTLVAMAKSVKVLDNNAFVDNGKINGEIAKRNNIRIQSQQDIGDIIINGQAERSRVQDQTNLGASDTLRDQNRFDDTSGNQYTAPLNAVRAFKHADGTVTYSTNTTDPVPSDAVELAPHQYK